MNKIQKLKFLWKNLCEAKREKRQIGDAITNVASYPVIDNSVLSCMRDVAVVDGREPLIVKFKCKNFDVNQECQKRNCPFVQGNRLFIKAHQKYINARRKFFNEFIGRSK